MQSPKQRMGFVLAGMAIATLLSASAQNPPQGQAPLAFDVISIKPSPPGNRPGGIRPLAGGQSYVATGVPVKLIMKLMYRINDSQISGGPGWLDTDRYDIQAKAEHPSNIDQLHEMFQTLLADRFQLKFHREMKEMSALVLTIDKSGPKLKLNESPQDFEIPIRPTARGKITGVRVPMSYFCWFLSQNQNRPVVDKTGLDKNYDFNLEWAPEIPPGAVLREGAAAPPVIDGPTLFVALREQLGLKLDTQKAKVEVFVIDHAERPSEN
jgi:uncharacterized protein (TIGR03435 family)